MRVLKLSPQLRLARARIAMLAKNTNYHLKWPNGGSDPESKYPGAAVEGKRFLQADCIGLVAWATGFARRLHREGFPDTPSILGGYVNTDSMGEEARGYTQLNRVYPGGKFFRILPRPSLGCIVVYQSRSRLYPTNPKVGHVGIVSSVPAEAPLNYEDWFALIKVIHCSSVDKVKGTAIRETTGLPWRRKNSLFVEFIYGQD